MHGGLIMSLTDTLGSLAVASRGQYMTGVSTDISTSFVKPAGKPGDELKVTATLTAMGAFTHVHRPANTPSLSKPCGIAVAVDSARCLFVRSFLF